MPSPTTCSSVPSSCTSLAPVIDSFHQTSTFGPSQQTISVIADASFASQQQPQNPHQHQQQQQQSPPAGNSAFIYLPLVDRQGNHLPIHFTTEKEFAHLYVSNVLL
ncbi:unnamed protein product [Protopolystoma xenopodis]|uniref:Uncharacterized protein n=1 Tax=Protopolystoma xenopodis TaxID=117903 RepID=A0A448WRW4_9PLAT|nr:unnamed protein product [Protopolystoma xenopodis]